VEEMRKKQRRVRGVVEIIMKQKKAEVIVMVIVIVIVIVIIIVITITTHIRRKTMGHVVPRLTVIITIMIMIALKKFYIRIWLKLRNKRRKRNRKKRKLNKKWRRQEKKRTPKLPIPLSQRIQNLEQLLGHYQKIHQKADVVMEMVDVVSQLIRQPSCVLCYVL